MAFSPTDPVSAHSLWLQLRSTKRTTRRPRWRSDWARPLWVPLLLLSLLALFYVMLPSNEAVEQAQQAAPKERILQESHVLGVVVGAEP